MVKPYETTAWSALVKHKTQLESFRLRDALCEPDRFKTLSLCEEGIAFDFSKNLIVPETLEHLYALARVMRVEDLRDQMFSGEKINTSEARAVLHTALRAPAVPPVMVDGENVMPFIHGVLQQMRNFSVAIRSGIHKGFTGQRITDVVNVGIGGSDLGPRFVVDALQDYCDGPKIHYVSNVDGNDITTMLTGLKPETTLFIVASKSFTTEETMLNAQVAKRWFLKAGQQTDIAKHFVALSTNEAAVLAFGIGRENIFALRDWVGGRYSLWSAVGLSIMLAVGPEKFSALLQGAHAMDHHFKTAPMERNIPIRMALLGVWYRNFWKYSSYLLLPYDNRFARFPSFIQQMDMESNGKAVDRDGDVVPYETGPIIFGEPGTNSQHSFMQLIHQSPLPIPADFILFKKPHHDLVENHHSLMANCLAQTRALAIGQTREEAGGDPFQVFTGNRPTTTILAPELSPFTLGYLIAAYEHKIFVQGAIWNLNSYDQPGVELGKKLAKSVRESLKTKAGIEAFDASTAGLLSALVKEA